MNFQYTNFSNLYLKLNISIIFVQQLVPKSTHMYFYNIEHLLIF